MRASPEAQDAGLRVGPGLQSTLFVGTGNVCMPLPFLALLTMVCLERAVGALYAEASRARSVSNEEILASSASTEEGVVEEVMRQPPLPDRCFDG